MTILRNGALLALLGLFLAACATQLPVRSNADQTADFNDYRTYGFVDRPGTDEADYTSLTTRYLQAAVAREMESRGYQFADDPDLLVNFYIRTREHTRVTERVGVGVHYGYGFRSGRYGVWGGYPLSRDVRTHTEGTLHIDLVDAERNPLVWEGIAEGRVTRAMRDDPQRAISEAVSDVFRAYQHRAPGL